MKKILNIVLVAVAVILAVPSCTIKEGGEISTSRKLLADYADNSSRSALEQLCRDFRQLYCVEQYINADPVTRDIQWFARCGRCVVNGDRILISSNVEKKEIQTNGKPLLSDGAFREYDGFRVACKQDSTLTFASKSAEFVVKVLPSGPTVVNLHESGFSRSEESDGYNALLNIDLNVTWDLTKEPGSYISDLFIFKGNASISVGIDSRELDWVKIKYTGSLYDPAMQTSRDRG